MIAKGGGRLLTFASGAVRDVDAGRAVARCLSLAYGEADPPADCRAVILAATLGHRLDGLARVLRERLPGATVLGASCSGVVGRGSLGESMNEVGLMCVSGPADECAHAAVDGMTGENAYEKGLELARALYRENPRVSCVYLLCPGIGMDHGGVLRAFGEVFGGGVPVVGGGASDNMRAIVSRQYCGGAVREDAAWALGLADPTLKAAVRATHGYVPYGDPLVVTEAEGPRIDRIDGYPAWQAYTKALGLPDDADLLDTLPIGALAEELPPDLALDYGNTHILRFVNRRGPEGSLFLPAAAPPGTRFWLTIRDERRIDTDLTRLLNVLNGEVRMGLPAAVLQADCMARESFLFRDVAERMTVRMQSALASGPGTEDVPPWLGLYGYAEYAPLGGRNACHNYSTALAVLYR